MIQRSLSTAALMLALLTPNAVGAQTWNNIATVPSRGYPWFGYYQSPNRCMVWDGYQWLNMCWRSRTFVSPAWTRFRY